MPKVLVTPEEILEAVSTIEGIYSNEPVHLIAIASLESDNFLDVENYDFDEKYFRRTGESRGLKRPNAVDRSYGIWQINFLPEYGAGRAATINRIMGGEYLKTERIRGVNPDTGKSFDFDLVTQQSLQEFFSPKHGKEELFRRNLIALSSVWSPGDDYSDWATHPDYKDIPEADREARDERYEAAHALAKELYEKINPPYVPSAEYLELEKQFLEAETEDERNRIRSLMGEEYNRRKEEPFEFINREDRPLINRETTPKLYDQDREVYLGEHALGEGIPIQLASKRTNMATDPEGIMPPKYKDKVAAGIWGWIGNNDALTIDGVHIIDIIDDPEQYGELIPGTPDYDEWVFGLLAQTEYYQNSWEDRAKRDLEWYTEAQHEAWSERRRSLVETELELIEGFIAEAQLDWTDDQILQAAKFAWLNGWDVNDIREFLISGELGDESFTGDLIDFDDEAIPGTLQNIGRHEITKTYNDYFVEPTERDIEDWATQMFLSKDGGDTELEQLKDFLREQAADLYPGHADRILAGRTPLAILGAYETVFQSVMGYKPQWVGQHRELAVDVLGRNDTATGFARYLRGTEEYDGTTNAVNKAFRTVSDLNRLMTGVG